MLAGVFVIVTCFAANKLQLVLVMRGEECPPCPVLQHLEAGSGVSRGRDSTARCRRITVRFPVRRDALATEYTKRISSSTGYKFLTHSTDAYIQALGSSLEEALRYAGQALVDILGARREKTLQASDVDKDHLGWLDIATVREKMTFQGKDEISLLRDWVGKVFSKSELENIVCSDFYVYQIKREGKILRGEAEVFGIREEKTYRPKKDRKMPTYPRLEVARQKKQVQVRFVIDL
jgi:SHS2 domain-containing protein